MYRTLALSVLAALVLVSHASAQQADKESKIRNALSAAPAAVAAHATVVDWDQTVLREGGEDWSACPTAATVPCAWTGSG